MEKGKDFVCRFCEFGDEEESGRCVFEEKWSFYILYFVSVYLVFIRYEYEI